MRFITMEIISAYLTSWSPSKLTAMTIAVFIGLALSSHKAASQSIWYDDGLDKLENMLENDISLSFKDAVYHVENAYLDGGLSYRYFCDAINGLKELADEIIINNQLNYEEEDKERIEIYAGIYKLMTDTTLILFDSDTLYHIPFTYDFEDIFGSKNWKQMFVSKLLKTHKGNCHSLPFLYKIIADEFKVPTFLSVAPNHFYIKQQSKKSGWYNTELTSASFPIDAWLMASGYISLESVQKGIYLDTLTEKECIALCVIDLAQGYSHKYPDNDGTFIIKCCDLALKHFPDYVNAILLKAETRLKQLQAMQKHHGYAYLKEVTNLQEGKNLWDEMNSLYMQLYQLGYRQMPEQMYVEWLTSLKTEKEKYTNKQVEQMNRN